MTNDLSSQRPCIRIETVLNQRRVKYLTVDPRDERELRLVLPVSLRFLECVATEVRC